MGYDKLSWRTGTKLGRTLYRQKGNEPSVEDEFIGMMETSELAERVAFAINDETSQRTIIIDQLETLYKELDEEGSIEEAGGVSIAISKLKGEIR